MPGPAHAKFAGVRQSAVWALYEGLFPLPACETKRMYLYAFAVAAFVCSFCEHQLCCAGSFFRLALGPAFALRVIDRYLSDSVSASCLCVWPGSLVSLELPSGAFVHRRCELWRVCTYSRCGIRMRPNQAVLIGVVSGCELAP